MVESFSVLKGDVGCGGGRRLFVITASGTKVTRPDQAQLWRVGLRLAAETCFHSRGLAII